MLNAFRHQRTRNAGLRAQRRRRLRVLNAFRHQRTRNWIARRGRKHQNPCSTPFGINERGTSIPPFVDKNPPSAQRLSASTNEELDRAPRNRPVPRVLNAFRHQRTRNKDDQDQEGRPWECAQRLSASTNEEPAREYCGYGWRMCSTPFGINERGT